MVTTEAINRIVVLAIMVVATLLLDLVRKKCYFFLQELCINNEAKY